MMNPSGDTPLNRLLGMSTEEASVVFATQFDEAIRSLREALVVMDGFDDTLNDALLEKVIELMGLALPMPGDLTVEESRPYVEMSDLLYLGLLADQLWTGRQKFIQRIEEGLI